MTHAAANTANDTSHNSVVQDISNIANENPHEAIKFWNNLAQQQDFSIDSWFQVVRSIGIGFATKKDPQALKWLAKLPAEYLTTKAHIWRVKTAILHGHWQLVHSWINNMPKKLHAQPIWQYWQGRALIALQDIVAARAILIKLAQQDHYYGVLARYKLPYTGPMPQYNDPIIPKQHIARVLNVAKNNAIDPAWLLAIAKKESAFKVNAKSDAGAIGLMQLLPSTAVMLAKNSDIILKNKSDLYDPQINLTLGGKYLKQLLIAQQHHPILATASYNAGPTKVRQWLPKSGNIDTDIWIEFIPYKETRFFVKQVVNYASNYKDILGTNIDLEKYFAPIAALS